MGDFSFYQGVWRFQELPGCAPPGSSAMRLTYSVELSPSLWVPVALLEGKIRGATSVAFVATAAARSGSCGGDGGAPLSGGGGGVGAEEEEAADAAVVGGAAAVHCERVVGVGPVFVDPTRAGRGAGRALMREVGPCARVSARRGDGAARRAHS